MQQKKMDKQGFGMIGVIAIAAAVIVIGLVGADLYSMHHDQEMVTTAAAAAKLEAKVVSTDTDRYAGWQTATLADEKATFKYPSSWSITNTTWAPSDTPGLAKQWGDTVTLISPAGLTVLIDTGDEVFNNPSPTISVLATQPIRTLGGDYNLVFYTAQNDPLIDVLQACVSASTTPGFDSVSIASKTQVQTEGEPGRPGQDDICIKYNSVTKESVSAYEKNPSFNDAKLIIESLTYQVGS